MLQFALTVFVLVILMFSDACTSRVVYDQPAKDTSQSNPININTATVAELEKLPRIGPKTAQAIVSYREANGPFQRVEDLMLLRGFSEKRFAEIRPFLRVE